MASSLFLPTSTVGGLRQFRGSVKSAPLWRPTLKSLTTGPPGPRSLALMILPIGSEALVKALENMSLPPCPECNSDRKIRDEACCSAKGNSLKKGKEEK